LGGEDEDEDEDEEEVGVSIVVEDDAAAAAALTTIVPPPPPLGRRIVDLDLLGDNVDVGDLVVWNEIADDADAAMASGRREALNLISPMPAFRITFLRFCAAYLFFCLRGGGCVVVVHHFRRRMRMMT
jgi:hypothetical protein